MRYGKALKAICRGQNVSRPGWPDMRGIDFVRLNDARAVDGGGGAIVHLSARIERITIMSDGAHHAQEYQATSADQLAADWFVVGPTGRPLMD